MRTRPETETRREAGSGRGDSPDALRARLAGALEVSPELLTPEARFVEDLGGASINLIIVVMELEEAYGIEITDEEAEGLRTLADVRRFLGPRLKEAGAAWT